MRNADELTRGVDRVGTQLRFSHDELRAFAAFSGDRNPIHLDGEHARSVGYHAPVVHGALASLTLLNEASRHGFGSVSNVRVDFHRALLCDETYSMRVRSTAPVLDAWQGDVIHTSLAVIDPARAAQAHAEKRCAEYEDWTRVPWQSSEGKCPENIGVRISESISLWSEAFAAVSYVAGMLISGRSTLIRSVSLRLLGKTQPARESMTRELAISRSTRDPKLVEIRGFGRGTECLWAAEMNVVHLDPGAGPLTWMCEPPWQPATRPLLVVGASRGLGAALSLLAARAGAPTVGVYRTSERAADLMRRLASDHGLPLTLIRGDCRQQATQSAMLDSFERSSADEACVVLSAFPEPSLERTPELSRIGQEITESTILAIQRRWPSWRGCFAYVSSILVQTGGSRQFQSYVGAKCESERLVRELINDFVGAGLLIARMSMFSSSRTAAIQARRPLPSAAAAAEHLWEAIGQVKPGERCVTNVWVHGSANRQPPKKSLEAE